MPGGFIPIYTGPDEPMNPSIWVKTMLIAEAQHQEVPGSGPWISDGEGKTILLRGTRPYLLTTILSLGDRWRFRKLGPMPIIPLLRNGGGDSYGPLITESWSEFFMDGELWIMPGPHADGRTLGAYG